MTAYLVAGSQAEEQKNNQLYILKMSQMNRTKYDGNYIYIFLFFEKFFINSLLIAIIIIIVVADDIIDILIYICVKQTISKMIILTMV